MDPKRHRLHVVTLQSATQESWLQLVCSEFVGTGVQLHLLRTSTKLSGSNASFCTPNVLVITTSALRPHQSQSSHHAKTKYQKNVRSYVLAHGQLLNGFELLLTSGDPCHAPCQHFGGVLPNSVLPCDISRSFLTTFGALLLFTVHPSSSFLAMASAQSSTNVFCCLCHCSV